MNKRFWEWLSKLSGKKLKEIHLKKHGVDLQCQHCKTWTHQSKKPGDISSFEHQLAVVLTCGECDKRSYWVCEGGFWLNAVDFGFSLEKLERDFHLYQVSKELEKLNNKTLVLYFTGDKNFKPQRYRLGGNTTEGINFITDDLTAPVQPSNEELFDLVRQAIAFYTMSSTTPNEELNYFEEFLTDKFFNVPEITQARLALVSENELDLTKATKVILFDIKRPKNDKA